MSDFTSSLKSRVSALAENARDLTLDFEAASGSRFFDNDEQTLKEVHTLLNSRLEREKLEALRRLIAVYTLSRLVKYQLMSRGTDVSSYFASVIQLIASPNLEIKKLVYIYLLRYAESNPDLALMSINTIQKSLSDKNQIVRGMALRVMSGIKVPLISGIVILGIRRCISDLSYFVRKTAAIAIIKCYEFGFHFARLILGLIRV
jgi:vesicle coat complex subunit